MSGLKTFVTVFLTVFLAEIGDKTQLATMLFASKTEYSKVMVFLAASLALICAALLGVVAGSVLESMIPRKFISIIAGGGFIIIGLIILIKGS
ncbi:hypothetical protein DBT_2011 [Dissulfuribacter thermophilus]|uniref:GDT1 family protein n=1 Tax=Dissulfuribacter thermophilus TaxID=1156395 RepID=A0A1B9F437_9BACT|nr:TMEM165/GDT1 family protein [Dissulfuribacter thermophilus]OCC14696.1 hypothetical protein DBT_2011 [Dissulfuribacter thermophilus]